MRKRNACLDTEKVVGFLVVTGLVALAAAGLLFAHARLVRSSPPDKAELSQPPKQLELWFDEILDREFNRVEVFPAGELKSQSRPNRAVGKPKLDAADRTHLTAELSPLLPGDYIVQWSVLSRDGHSVRGRFAFRILAPPEKK